MHHHTATRVVTAALLVAAAQGASAEPKRYTLDMTHTDIHFSIMRFGFNRVIGHFRDAEGTIAYDAVDIANSSVEVTIDATSIDSGNDTRDGHLNGEFWLNTAAHPTITFRSTSVARNDDGTLAVTGELAIKGETLPVTLAVTVNKTGTEPASKREAIGVTARTELDRTAFGVATAPNLIANDVHVHIEALGLAGGE